MVGLQGRIFGGYQLGDQLGGGGIAQVYRARPQKPGGREVVVKLIYPEFARQPGFLANFQRIVQMSSRLSSHPHILPLVASGEENGHLYLVTPYVAGGSLKEWITRGGRLGPSDVAPFFRQLCDALGYAHSLGAVHGNLKPSNIFLFEGRHVLVGDFGLLWDIRSMDMTHAGPGTEAFEYMAPELATGQASQLSDVYSAGIVLFTALLGYAPFRAATPAEVFAAHARQTAPHLAQLNPSLPPAILALDGTIQRAIAKRPDERFPSASALAQAIEVTLRQAAAVHGQSGAVASGWQNASAGLPPRMTPFGANPLGTPLLSSPLPGSPSLGANGAAFSRASFAPGPSSGLSGGAAPGRAPGMSPLEPAFPPLPPSAYVEADMEQGRIRVSGTGDVPQQSTMRVPAPQPPPAAANGTSGDALGSAPFAPPVGSPRLGLGPQLAPQMGDDDQNGPQSMPVVRPNAGAIPASPSLPGFAVAGGGGSWPQENGNGHQLDEWEGDGRKEPMSGASNWGDWGRDGTPGDGTGQQPSRIPYTQLGLPRLTSPALQDMPPSWYELIGQAPPGTGRMSDPGRSGVSRAPSGWEAAVDGGWDASQAPPQQHIEDGGWDPSESGSWQVQGLHQDWDDASGESGPMAPEMAEAWQGSGPLSSGVPMPPTPGHVDPARNGHRSHPYVTAEDDENFWVEDDRVWTNGHRAIRRPLGRRRWMRRLVVLLFLCLLVDASAVVVQRPELCPTTACAAISAKVHTLLGQLQPRPTQPPDVASAQPATLSLTVKANKSASANITVKNLTAAAVGWQSSSSLTWVKVAPPSGVLAANSTAKFTVTANAAGIKAGTYTATITVSPSGGKDLHITVTVTVT